MYAFQIRKIKLALFVYLSIPGMTFAQHHAANSKGISTQEILFNNSNWKEATAEAKKTGKYIFVDAYASWCAPCKLLTSTTFKDKDAVAFFNQNFINFRVDVEQGEGLGLASQWDISAYPALLFFNPDGKLLLKNIGYIDGKKLISVGQQAVAKR